jgi:hypothetical protein
VTRVNNELRLRAGSKDGHHGCEDMKKRIRVM